MHAKNNVVMVISSMFILLFVYTALSKWLDFDSFKDVLAHSPLIGSLSFLVACLIPVLELWVAALLFFPSLRRVGLYASLILMIVFTGHLVYMLLYAPELPCSCGGVLRYLSWRSHVLFNISWILLALIAIKLDASQGVSRKPE